MAEDSLLAVRFRHRQGSLIVDVDFRLGAPWTVIFGPSGSGKSTILRTIAGFVHPDSGYISVAPSQRVLLSTEQNVHVPAYRRPVRSAGQVARLFPRMRLRDNVSFGLGSKLGLEHAAETTGNITRSALRLFHLEHLAERWPQELSGGERQRASVARAVVSAVGLARQGHAMLLLDEPFSGLDAALRDELAVELRSFLEAHHIPVLSVSHDVVEVFLLQAEVIRVSEGKIVSQGPPEIVLHGERDRVLTGLGG